MGKLVSQEEAAGILEAARAVGRVVVFTNGCFDLLHAGHVEYLQRAKALGDLLVVGVNSDDSVRRIKGPDRPINRLADRSLVLAGLASVDLVVPFEEADPGRLISTLQPDILVKGEDWPEEDIVGREVVASRGGKVVRIPVRAGLSTSLLVERILRSRSTPGKGGE